jgi:hypothetical protein
MKQTSMSNITRKCFGQRFVVDVGHDYKMNPFDSGVLFSKLMIFAEI